MKYNRYEIGPYNIHIIKTDKFKKNVISVNFKRKVKKEELTIRNLLSTILVKSTNNYKSERDIFIKSEDLYNAFYDSNVSISGNYSILNFELAFLNPKYTEEGMLNESLNFLFEMLFNPNISSNQFDEQAFILSKNEVLDSINSLEESPKVLAIKKLYENMDKDSPFAYDANGYIEDLEKITSKELYKYYKSVLKSDNIDIFVIGDFNENQIKNLIIKNFQVNTIKRQSGTHYLKHKKLRNKIKVAKLTKELNQSILTIGFKLTGLTDFEKQYVMKVYNYILGGGADSKLFKTVREKNGMCYAISSSVKLAFNIMTITSGISAKDFKKAVFLIKQELKNMEKGKFTDNEIEEAKAIYKSSFSSLLDSPDNIIGMYRAKEYLGLDLIDTRLKEIDKVDKQMIIKLAKKINIDTIFLLEGDSHE